jgi:predicted nucleic acid-binding protein
MIIISDTSPFIVLLKINCVEILPQLFERILIPQEVLKELSDPKHPQYIGDFARILPSWIEVQTVENCIILPGLDLGESAAIALAEKLQAKLLIDEQLGRKVAVGKGIEVLGTIGVLIVAAEAKIIDLEIAFDNIKQTDFWVRHSFLDDQLKLFREREDRN